MKELAKERFFKVYAVVFFLMNVICILARNQQAQVSRWLSAESEQTSARILPAVPVMPGSVRFTTIILQMEQVKLSV